MGVTATCHCGAVGVLLPGAPARIIECGCSVCRKLGMRWAYYPPAEVEVSGNTDTYVCNNRVIEFHRCCVCGCTSHWSSLGTGFSHMGVNARLLDDVDLSRIERRILPGPSPAAFD